MKPYSMDLRERIAAAVDHHDGSLRPLARTFRVSLSCIARLLARRRATGSLQPKPHGGGQPPALDTDALQRLRHLVQQRPDATLDELARRLGVACSRMAIWRALRKLGITRKKKTLHARERDSPRVRKLRRAFGQELAEVDPARLVFVDESGTNTAMTPPYGRAPRGERVAGAVPGPWESQTLIAGLRLSGVVAPLTFAGATDTATFRAYAAQALAPELRPGDVVIWDNLQPHKDAGAVQAVAGAGARVVPAPPWSPDLLPVEKLWSKAKAWLRRVAARTKETVEEAMGAALWAVCPQDIVGWFQSCGWAPDEGQPTGDGTGERRDRLKAPMLCVTHP
jgi:transposase